MKLNHQKKPLIYYYGIAILILMLFNLFALPWITRRTIKIVDYSTFMEMTENKQIGRVEIKKNQIIFTDKDNKAIYMTGVVDDPGLAERLYRSGAKFSGEIYQETSPLLKILFSWILPILIFIGIGRFLSKKLMNKTSGNSLMFGLVNLMLKYMYLLQMVLSSAMWQDKMRRRKV